MQKLVFSLTIKKKKITIFYLCKSKQCGNSAQNFSVENDLVFTNHIIFHLDCQKNLDIYYYFYFINDENYRRVIFNFAKAVLTDVNYVTINSAQKSIKK